MYKQPVGCSLGTAVANHLINVDYLLLLAPSAKGLQTLLGTTVANHLINVDYLLLLAPSAKGLQTLLLDTCYTILGSVTHRTWKHGQRIYNGAAAVPGGVLGVSRLP